MNSKTAKYESKDILKLFPRGFFSFCTSEIRLHQGLTIVTFNNKHHNIMFSFDGKLHYN